MKRLKRLGMWLMLAAWAMTCASDKAHAVTSQNLDIRVSIVATKSLLTDTTFYNFGALDVSVASNSATAIKVTNNSGGLTETYTIQGANATSDTGGDNWTLASSTGTLNEYALAAQFSDARPGNTNSTWSSDALTTSAIVCTSTTLGNGTAGESGASVPPTVGLNERNLWFRIKTPNIVSDGGGHTATVTLAVQ